MADVHPHITSMLQKYDLNKDSVFEALREILQEIVLYSLGNAGFFKEAVFYGGTALRILYGLPRFSEDLDFSLIKVDLSFDLGKYEDAVIKTLKTYGFSTEVEVKKKTNSNVQSAFLKGDTVQHLMTINAPDDIVKKFHAKQKLKIKFEVDTHPPLNFHTNEALHLLPAPFMIKSMTIESLFAGKLHALLCRGWKNRPKGRDWYDLVWYIQNSHKADMNHLATRLMQSCSALTESGVDLPSDVNEYNEDLIKDLLTKRVDLLDIEAAKSDVVRFIRDSSELDIWSKEFFHLIITKIEFI